MAPRARRPTRSRNHNGYLLRWDGDQLLFDPGEGTQRQMLFAGVTATQITRICITHFHGDHCLGLRGCCSGCRWTGSRTKQSPGAIERMEDLGIDGFLLRRHVTGDWGDIHPDDRGLNEQALRDGGRIFSVYGKQRGAYDERLWVMTEADRSAQPSCVPRITR